MVDATTLTKLEPCVPSAVALGYFDGVHLGHRTVLNAAARTARERGIAAGVFTFSLPDVGGFKGARILETHEKRRRIASLGFDFVMRPPFESFSTLSPEQFVGDVLVGMLGARAVFCGPNFTFGKNKAGNVDVLRALCAGRGVEVDVMPITTYKGERVSSTRIRAALAAGDIEDVNAMLGEDYAVELPVRHGEQLGRTLGFPTINQVYPAGTLVPRSGVYITEVTLADGSRHPGATGIGSRPTVSDDIYHVTCETFLPGFSGDVYGETARVRFCKWLWPTRKFDSVEQLADMVRRAAGASLEYHAGRA